MTLHSDEVVEVAAPSGAGGRFVAKTRDGRVLESKKLLLATGMRDVVPDVMSA